MVMVMVMAVGEEERCFEHREQQQMRGEIRTERELAIADTQEMQRE